MFISYTSRKCPEIPGKYTKPNSDFWRTTPSSNTFQTSTFLATAFWKFRKKIMQALYFLHCDHVIKIQCRKSTPCRISFAAVCDLVTFHPCICKSCIREIFLSSINKNKKYWCFVLPWFSMSMEIEAHQQSSLQWASHKCPKYSHKWRFIDAWSKNNLSSYRESNPGPLAHEPTMLTITP